MLIEIALDKLNKKLEKICDIKNFRKERIERTEKRFNVERNDDFTVVYDKIIKKDGPYGCYRAYLRNRKAYQMFATYYDELKNAIYHLVKNNTGIVNFYTLTEYEMPDIKYETIIDGCYVKLIFLKRNNLSYWYIYTMPTTYLERMKLNEDEFISNDGS